MKRKVAPLGYVLEMIQPQTDNFGEKLEAIFTTIREKIKESRYIDNKALEESSEVDALKKAIYDRIGLRTKVYCNRGFAAILPFYPNKNSIFIPSYFRGNFSILDQEKILKKAVDKKGYVDTQKAKLGGIFSDYENHLHLNFESLFNIVDLTPPEVAAVTLHEIGHGFSSCEYSDRLQTGNQILVHVAKALVSDKKDVDKEYVFKEMKNINDKDYRETIDKIVTGNKVVAGASFFELAFDIVQSSLPNDKYDETSFEQLADNFASRFGYGRHLVTGLDKLYKMTGAPEKYASVRYMQRLAEVVVLIVSIVAILVGFWAVALILLPLIIGPGEGARNYTYDKLVIRYKRIRQDYIEILKDEQIDKKMKDEIIDSIYMLDDIIKNTSFNDSIYATMSNILIGFNRRAKRSIEDQQLLETLVANDIFLKAAQLSR